VRAHNIITYLLALWDGYLGRPTCTPSPLGPDSQEVIHSSLSRLLSPALGGVLWGPSPYLHASTPHTPLPGSPGGPVWLQFPFFGTVITSVFPDYNVRNYL